jgi:hypothetical protein
VANHGITTKMESYIREYPCKKYYDNENIKDSFITKQHQLADVQKVREIGLAAYQAELEEKVGILERLGAELPPDAAPKEKATRAVSLFQQRAGEQNILFELQK